MKVGDLVEILTDYPYSASLRKGFVCVITNIDKYSDGVEVATTKDSVFGSNKYPKGTTWLVGASAIKLIRKEKPVLLPNYL